MVIVLAWLLLGILVGWCASKWGRSAIGYTLLSLLLSPLVGLVVLLFSGKKAASGKHKKCQFCAEEILSEAKVCKHCGKDQVDQRASVDRHVSDEAKAYEMANEIEKRLSSDNAR